VKHRSVPAAPAAVAVLAGCLPGGTFQPHGNEIAEALVDRRVVYSLSEKLRAEGGKPEEQVWHADGTATYRWRPLLRPERTYPRTHYWWTEGNRYCETPLAEKRGTDGRCYYLRINGDSIVFEVITEGMFDIFAVSRVGRFVD
jgi:hypothetical protein